MSALGWKQPAFGPLNVKTARSWCGIVPFYAPRTGGAYDSYHRTAGIAGCTRRRGGGLAAAQRAYHCVREALIHLFPLLARPSALLLVAGLRISGAAVDAAIAFR